MSWQQIVALLLAIMAADQQIAAIQPGETALVDTPDVAFKRGKTRYDIVAVSITRAE